MCNVSKSCFAASFVKSLNPHCVSCVLIPNKKVMMNLKTALMNFLWNFLWTFPSSYMCLLDPTTMAKGCPFSLTIDSNFYQTLSRSEKVVAPSASTIRTLSPWAIDIPALTAPPLPLFLGYSRTNRSQLSYFPFEIATYEVLSLDPSLAMMISYFLLDFFKCLTVSSNIMGNLYCSL